MVRAATCHSRATSFSSRTRSSPSGARIASVDFLKAVAIFAVICIHTMPFRGLAPLLATSINDISRFAVPYFFIVSGYFFARRFYDGAPLGELYQRTTSRLILAFAIASALYLVEPNFSASSASGAFSQPILQRISAAADHPARLLLEGTKPQLWFLVSLAMALSIFAALAQFGREDRLFRIAIPLYEFGVLAGAYAATPLGFHVAFNTRDGPFFSTLFVAIGAWLARTGYRPPLRLAIGLIVAGLALHGIEADMLDAFYGESPFGIDYVHGTALYGMGVAFLALARPTLAEGSAPARWGRLTLGIYLIHFLAIDLLKTIAPDVPTLSWQFLFPAGVLVVALGMTRAAACVPVLRKVVI